MKRYLSVNVDKLDTYKTSDSFDDCYYYAIKNCENGSSIIRKNVELTMGTIGYTFLNNWWIIIDTESNDEYMITESVISDVKSIIRNEKIDSIL